MAGSRPPGGGGANEDECRFTTVKNGAGRGVQPEPEPAHPADAAAPER